MRRFKWIDWNLAKIGAHGLAAEEVESAFDRVLLLRDRSDNSFEMFAEIPSGRRVWVICGMIRRTTESRDVFGDVDDPAIFVITAY